MHAGDALWLLYAELTMLERRYSTSSSTLELLAKMRDGINVIGQFIQVNPPPPEKIQQLIETVAATLSQDAAEPQQQHEQPQSKGGGSNVNFSDPERIEAAKVILEEMVESGHFDWADMISDLDARMRDPNPFITDRQFRAIVNIGRKGNYGQFWDDLAQEHPESARIAEESASRAG